MRKNTDSKEKMNAENAFYTHKNSAEAIEGQAKKQDEIQSYDTSILSHAHHNFGNGIVQDSLSGEGSLLESFIHSGIVSEMIGFSDTCRDAGNVEMQQILRDQLRGTNSEESFPDTQDPRISRIQQSGGSPLPIVLRQKLEAEFGHNFDHVRIHNTGADAESAQALHAYAFTVGSHIFFGRGNYNPKSQSGMELLAHELTHVVQFDEGRIQSSSGEMEVSSPTDAVEIEAVQKGAEVARSISYSGFESLQTGLEEDSPETAIEGFSGLEYSTANHSETATEEDASLSSNTVLRVRQTDDQTCTNSDVIDLFIKEINQGGRSKAEEMYKQAPIAERGMVEDAIREALGEEVLTEISAASDVCAAPAVPQVEKTTSTEAPEKLELEQTGTAPKEKASRGGAGSASLGAMPQQNAPEEGLAKASNLEDLGIDDLSLIHQELVEHQNWSGAQTRVGMPGTPERAAFIAEKAGEGALSGAGESIIVGVGTGIVGRLATRFIPIPGVGAILGGAMSAYSLINDWDQTCETIGSFGQGESQYEVIANSIASISGFIDLACNIMNVLAGLIGVLSAVMWIISIVTVGVASPLAATLSGLAMGIGVATGILDIINNAVLQPCVLLFRALHTFQNEADPRSVEAEGAGIADASGKVAGFFAGKGVEKVDSFVSSRSSKGSSNSGGDGSPSHSSDGPSTQGIDGPTSQAADGHNSQAIDGPETTSSPSPVPEASTYVPDTSTPAFEAPHTEIDAPEIHTSQSLDAPTQTQHLDAPTPTASQTPHIDAPTSPASPHVETPTAQSPDAPQASSSKSSPAETASNIEVDMQERRSTGIEAIQESRQQHIETKARAAQVRQEQIDAARQRAQQQAMDNIEADRRSRYQAIDAQQQARQQQLESGRSTMDQNIRETAVQRYIADIDAATQANKVAHETATAEFDHRRTEAETGRTERQALIDREYILQNVNEVEVRHQEQRRLAEIEDPAVRSEYEARWEESRRIQQQAWEQDYNQKTRANDKQYTTELEAARNTLSDASSRSMETHHQAMQDAKAREQRTIEDAHRNLDADIARSKADADAKRATVDTEMEGRQGEVTSAGDRAAQEASSPAQQQEADTIEQSRNNVNDTRRREGWQAIKDGMDQERAAYIAQQNAPKTESEELPEGYNRWALFGDPSIDTPASRLGRQTAANQGTTSVVKTAVSALKTENKSNKGSLERSAENREFSPKYEEPPASPEQLDQLVQQIDHILAGRAQAETAEQKMSAEKAKHEANKAPIGAVKEQASSASTAQEAHQQAVARTAEANKAQQERQKQSQQIMDGYPERMAGLAVITGPLKILQGLTWIGSKIPGRASRAMGRLNEDANKMSEAFSQMNTQMEAQSKGQESHKAALDDNAQRLTSVSEQGQESKGNLDSASQGVQSLEEKNQSTIQSAGEAQAEAAQQREQLNAAAEQKKTEHQSLKDRLVTWAKGHRDARLATHQKS